MDSEERVYVLQSVWERESRYSDRGHMIPCFYHICAAIMLMGSYKRETQPDM